MTAHVALVRALTGEVIHPELEVKPGDDTRKNSLPGDMRFAVAPEWHQRMTPDGSFMLEEQKTLVVAERANGEIRQVGLVDHLDPQNDQLVVSCGGFSMLAAQSGPWEGHQGYYVTMDPVTLFHRVWEQVQSYPNSRLGIRITGDTSSGSSVGYPGSARWQDAHRQYTRYKPQLDLWQGRLLTRERTLSQREEAMFRAAGLKRVGSVNVTDNEPDDPEWAADSTLWVREETRRAYRWRNGRWVSQSQADSQVRSWLSYRDTRDRGKDEVDRLRYLMEPAQELLDQYEREAREEYSLYFWQNHNPAIVMEELMAIGPFEYREHAEWVTGSDGQRRLDLQLEVGAPRVGVRRPELHLELGRNIHGDVRREYGPTYTGVAQFGAGTGSEVLSEQRNWNPQHVVRNILTDTDKDAHNRQLTRAAANKLRDRAQREAGIQFTDLTIYHDKACPEGSFDVGDQLYVTGNFPDGTKANRWVRVLTAKHPWGSNETVIEVENA